MDTPNIFLDNNNLIKNIYVFFVRNAILSVVLNFTTEEKIKLVFKADKRYKVVTVS